MSVETELRFQNFSYFPNPKLQDRESVDFSSTELNKLTENKKRVSGKFPQTNPDELWTVLVNDGAVEDQDIGPSILSDISYQESSNQPQNIASRALEKVFSNEPEVPFAFNLSREKELILKYGSAYWEFFRSQVTYYIAETYGKISETPYKHDVRINDQGKYEIGFWVGEDWVRASESYGKILQDASQSSFCKYRAQKDVAWAGAIERGLDNDSKATYFDLSPAPFEIPLEERQQHGFSTHSFARLHKLVDEKGGKKLVSLALRNYLALEEQTSLFTILNGKNPEGELLGRVGLLRPVINVGMVNQLIDDLYSSTPENRKIGIPKETKTKTKKEVEKYIKSLEKWLRGVFLLMEDPGIGEEIIEKQFQGFEMTVRDLIEGKNITDSSLRDRLIFTEELGLPDIWQTDNSSGECKEIECKQCGWKPKEKDLAKMEQGLLKCCPVCEWKPGDKIVRSSLGFLHNLSPWSILKTDKIFPLTYNPEKNSCGRGAGFSTRRIL